MLTVGSDLCNHHGNACLLKLLYRDCGCHAVSATLIYIYIYIYIFTFQSIALALVSISRVSNLFCGALSSVCQSYTIRRRPAVCKEASKGIAIFSASQPISPRIVSARNARCMQSGRNNIRLQPLLPATNISSTCRSGSRPVSGSSGLDHDGLFPQLEQIDINLSETSVKTRELPVHERRNRLLLNSM